MEIHTKKGKYVGRLQDGVYYTLRKAEHFMIKFHGFGISEDILETLAENKCRLVKIRYAGVHGTEEFECDFKVFMTSTKTHLNEEDDWQRFVDINDMKKIGEVSLK